MVGFGVGVGPVPEVDVPGSLVELASVVGDRVGAGCVFRAEWQREVDLRDICTGTLDVLQVVRYAPLKARVIYPKRLNAALEIAQRRRNTPTELVARQVQVDQVCQVSDRRRNTSSQTIVAKVQVGKAGEFAQLSRDLSAQLVASQVQVDQVAQVSQLRRYVPDKLVVIAAGPSSQFQTG